MPIYTLMPLHEALGLAVIGIDLGQPIDPELGENLTRLLAQHLVLVFPGQSLTPQTYLAAATAFGAPIPHAAPQDRMPGHPDIGLIRYRNNSRGAAAWHTDHPDRERPPAVTMFYGIEIPSTGGVTSVADMRAAYWALSEDERRHLEKLRTVNGHKTRSEDPAQYSVPVVHPMVRTHPISRERAIYFHPTRALYIEGMTPQASRDYLAGLVDRLIQPEIVYHHNWVEGDVLVIDARATLRRADTQDECAEPGVFWRIIIEGERPTLV
jgi:taurine dioxygenase